MVRYAWKMHYFLIEIYMGGVVKLRSTSEPVLRVHYGPSIQLPNSHYAIGC